MSEPPSISSKALVPQIKIEQSDGQDVSVPNQILGMVKKSKQKTQNPPNVANSSR
jgi:hypothetical protein